MVFIFSDSVTILFCHLTSITKMAAALKPQEVVGMLDALFNAYDRLADRHKLEKIKTIGPTYMLAGGIPLPCTTHCQDAAEMALDVVHLLLSGKFVHPVHGSLLRARVG